MTVFLENSTNWVLVSFIVFFYVFFKYGYRSITDKLDGKIETIQKELQTVETLRIEAQELLAQYQRKHRDAMKEVDEIIDQAKTQAQNMRTQAEKELEVSKKARHKQLEERLTRVEQEAILDIRNYAVSLSVQASEVLIKDKMDKKTTKALIDNTVKNIPDYLN